MCQGLLGLLPFFFVLYLFPYQANPEFTKEMDSRHRTGYDSERQFVFCNLTGPCARCDAGAGQTACEETGLRQPAACLVDYPVQQRFKHELARPSSQEEREAYGPGQRFSSFAPCGAAEHRGLSLFRFELIMLTTLVAAVLTMAWRRRAIERM
mmetsp:Transcript_10191/g.24326  ORF Transcript_10191/g.24326 Transcript_10191/m.24326 type:complete len:153 (-) Transcript_10191:451-909(-)